MARLAMGRSINGRPRARISPSLTAMFDKIISRDVGFGASIFPKVCWSILLLKLREIDVLIFLDACYAPRWWADCKVAQNIVFWKEHQLGGHFPSVEQPAVLAADIREFTKALDARCSKS